MRNIKTRLKKLEEQKPGEKIILRVNYIPGEDPPLTPEEEAILKAEADRQLQESDFGVVVVFGTREEVERIKAFNRGNHEND